MTQEITTLAARRDETRRAASRVGELRTPLKALQAQQAQEALDAAQRVANPIPAPRHRMPGAILPGQKPLEQ